jgi:hypothetical protein
MSAKFGKTCRYNYARISNTVNSLLFVVFQFSCICEYYKTTKLRIHRILVIIYIYIGGRDRMVTSNLDQSEVYNIM